METYKDDNDPISLGKNKAKSEYDWAKDALAHGFTEKELKKMSEEKKEKLKDYIDSCNKTT